MKKLRKINERMNIFLDYFLCLKNIQGVLTNVRQEM